MTRNCAGILTVAVIGLCMAAAILSSALAADPPKDEWIAPARAAKKKNPIPANDESIAAGKAVYAAQCLSCHGPTGHGDGPAAKDLNPKPRNLSEPAIQGQTDGSIFWKLTEGKKPMPTFEKLLTENDRWNAINYVRTLAGKEGKP
jgi:mono/diheme cytochrome c family protein